MTEFDITIKIRVEAENMKEADEIADAIVSDLNEEGYKYIDRPINAASWDLITPAIEGNV